MENNFVAHLYKCLMGIGKTALVGAYGAKSREIFPPFHVVYNMYPYLDGK